MKNKLKFKLSLIFIIIGFFLGMMSSNLHRGSKLNKHYLNQFKEVKHRMLYGSPVDSQEELSRYHDQIELCMHLDGYNGLEIMDIRTKAFGLALQEKGSQELVLNEKKR